MMTDRNSRLRAGAIALAAGCAVSAFAAATPAAASAAGGTGCATISVPVALAQGSPADQAVSAQYCRPAGRATAIDVLVPGATYNHKYWDWPVDPRTYNFTDKLTGDGQAVLDYDPVGTGSSSHPPSTALTFASDVYVLHQLIAWARRSGYADVNVIGHSMGSFVAVQDAGTWPSDPSRLVLTGYLNTITPGGAAALTTDLYPADQDPLFAGAGLDAGYLTTVPGTRGALFYDAGNAAPAVIAYDEAHKDAVTATELSSLLPVVTAPATGNIATNVTAPVLIVVGQQDALVCTGGPVDCASWQAMRAYEAPYFAAAASLTAISIPGTGHDVALSPTADASAAAILTWLALTPAQSAPGA